MEDLLVLLLDYVIFTATINLRTVSKLIERVCTYEEGLVFLI